MTEVPSTVPVEGRGASWALVPEVDATGEPEVDAEAASCFLACEMRSASSWMSTACFETLV